jgi:hypothetical protein
MVLKIGGSGVEWEMSMLDSHRRRKINLRWILKLEQKSPQFYMQALIPGQKVNCCLIKSSNISNIQLNFPPFVPGGLTWD